MSFIYQSSLSRHLIQRLGHQFAVGLVFRTSRASHITSVQSFQRPSGKCAVRRYTTTVPLNSQNMSSSKRANEPAVPRPSSR